MAALQDALQTLSPIDAITVPQSPTDLETFLNTTFDTSQLLIDSIPLPATDSLPTRPRSSTTTSIASSASEITLSSARPDSPPPDVSKLQKAWGKPLRLAAKDNPLGMSVYKLAGTDGKGAWFARRSVHCGLGFERWKRALQQEFPETMKIHGGPGVGNIRGIGGERCVECREAGGGKMEVYHLSAQFPGPTTPRDFVTMLMTTERREEGGPRQFMIVSKPCIHPQTPVRDGFIRGQYQSVEFIREVPVLPTPTKSASMNDLTAASQPAKSRKRAESQASSLNRSAVLRNANSSHPGPCPAPGHTPTRTPSEDRRQRGHTISFAGSRGVDAKGEYHDIPADDPERNPVEWIMLTRSDPGGSVPRFMVERGTPGSIVADAAKFLNWACSAALDVAGDEVPPRVDTATNESPEESETEIEHPAVPGEEPRPRPPPTPRAHPHPHPPHRASTEISLREFQTNGHLAGLDGVRDPPPNEHYTPPITTASLSPPEQNNRGVLSMVTNAASAISNFLPSAGYAAVLPHAQARERRYSTSSSSSSEEEGEGEGEGGTDLGSPSGGSYMSFESARERGSFDDADESADAAFVDAASVPPVYGVPAPLGPSSSEESAVLPDPAIRTVPPRPSSSSSLVVEDAGLLRARRRAAAAIEKEEGKFRERKRRLVEKVEKVRRKEGEGEKLRKAEERYLRDLAREESRLEREVERVERRRTREEAKVAKGKGEGEAEREVQVLRVERELLRRQVGELQRENTVLAMGIGRMEGGEKVLSELRGGRAESLGVVTAPPLGGKENVKV
ncbi:hypothetical protein V499_04489 [Pseudogymnoascus sp. VKM F-103]|nr:hypothetical protein V499_04489 [Pseudogymnoascus sp. VKM F-103]